MKGLLITHRGLEKYAEIEVNEILKTKTKTKKSIVEFDIKDYKDLAKLSYQSQSAIQVLLLLDKGKLEKKPDFEKIAKDLDLGEFSKIKKFCVFPKRIGEHEFNSNNIMHEFGGTLKDKYKLEVNLHNPDFELTFYVINDEYYIGVNFSVRDLSKRDYNIFLANESLKGTAAFCLLKAIGYKKDSMILDPISRNGVIPIESALYSKNISPHFYRKDKFNFLKLDDDLSKEIIELDQDKDDTRSRNIFCFERLQKDLKATEKNAKIAGVNKSITFSRIDLDWMDTKLDKESLDIVLTFPPQYSKTKEKTRIDKILKELFHQADFAVKKEGKLGIIMLTETDLIGLIDKAKFKQIDKIEFWQGKRIMFCNIFQKA